MPLLDLGVGWQGTVVGCDFEVEFLRFDPAAWAEGFVGFAEVVGPGADGIAGADAGVDEVE